MSHHQGDINGAILHSNTTTSNHYHSNYGDIGDRNTTNITTQQQYHHHHIRTSGPQKSIEGWIVFVTGVNEEAEEDDLFDVFSEYAGVKHMFVNRDRRTGLVKGYALVEYETFTEAQDTINGLHGKRILGKEVGVDWAFVKPTHRVAPSSQR
mmetsp:Transcript_37251/g.42534  ORF Transcript_37251/g.42534 Transcript_37251/m.42534 type:complete len:152 (-) Transcript_37251:99-554(-)|eukprot:CAMPEP_0194146714 /NCGR_PEP_ID=MMETSP0152-20130528/21458_1 /TAXON_ID=1049557 /ORGANISM="Thalassiothrix antarctica, Strain L6-D1" /LENGTH=151 /DNA_ID=CAMNT_0038847301 /DNA_START=89 /DNA_END=544 /DNA_ORIENTATION=-